MTMFITMALIKDIHSRLSAYSIVNTTVIMTINSDSNYTGSRRAS